MPQMDLNRIKSEQLSRTFTFQRNDVDEENRTVKLAFSSEEPIERWFGYEILDHSPESVDLGRLDDSGPLLVDHDYRDHVGVVESVSIDSDKRGRAVVRFGRSERANEIFQDIQDGIRSKVSVGYRINDLKLESMNDKEDDTYRASWTPHEISIVSIPADNSVGVGRSENMKEERTMPDVQVQQNTAPDVDVKEIEARAAQSARSNEIERIKNITNVAKRFSQEALAEKAVNEGWSADKFREAVLDAMPEQQITRAESSEIGLTEREAQDFRFTRLLAALSHPTNRKLQDAAGFEFECSRAAAQLFKRDPKGVFIPTDVLARDLTVGTATEGGHTVATNLLSQNFIELLRNQTVVVNASTVLSGLEGNLAIPRQTGGATAYWVAEGAAPTESQEAFDQVSLSPETVGAFTDFSRKLFLQSSMDIEAFVRNDLARTLAIELDRVCINGSGASNQPEGILNIAGIGDVAIGTNGGAPTFDSIIDLETDVDVANALVGNTLYLTNATMRGQLKKTRIEAGTSDMVWPVGGTMLNGYEAMVTNNVPSNLTKGSSTDCSAIIFGNFADLIVGFWSGLDILVDPYTSSASGTVRVTAHQDVDLAVRHVGSFSAIQDARAI